MGKVADEIRKYHLEIELAALRSHELHMKHIYGVRYAGLAIALAAIVSGAWMVFKGLQGTFNWAVEAPATISSKLTNASPGIGFAVVGMIIAFIVVLQKPVSYKTGGGPTYRFGRVNIGELDLAAKLDSGNTVTIAGDGHIIGGESEPPFYGATIGEITGKDRS